MTKEWDSRPWTPENRGRWHGYISHQPDPSGKTTKIRTLHVDDDRRRMGVATGLMHALEEKYGAENIDHGERTEAGKGFWKAYSNG